MNMVKRGKTDESNISLSVQNKSYGYEIVKNRVYYQAKFSVSSQCMINIEDSYRHRGLRKHLVESLKEDKWGVNPETGKRVIVKPGIKDEAVLNAIGKIPRHFFFGSDTTFYETYAYQDVAFQIGEDQTISQPYTVARQSELLQIKPNEKVLEIGTGSGYQATVLMLLKARVFSIERHKILHDRTSKFLTEIKEYLLGSGDDKKDANSIRTWKTNTEYWPVQCSFGDGFEGLPLKEPFDKIIITAAVPVIPEKLLAQLCVGGVMVLPYGTESNCDMLRITKGSNGQNKTETFEKFAFVPMLEGKVSKN